MEAAAFLLAALIAARDAAARVESRDARVIAEGVRLGAFAVLVGGVILYALFFVGFAL